MGQLECKSLSTEFEGWSGNYSCLFRTNEWHVLCGASGSGKSTLFNLILGLTRPCSGDLLIDGKTITHFPPHKRNISYMSQANSLFPAVSIIENLKLGLHDQFMTTNEKIDHIFKLTDRLKINSNLLNKLPSRLSGGELSRCNLARALLRPCRWLLLDEPFAAVDRPTRLSILSWLKHWQMESSTGIILISHDLDDIFTVASHITVISNGHVVENSAIIDSLDRPSHILTAKMVRSGIVTEANGRNFFVNSKHIHLRRDKLSCGDEFVKSISLNAPRTTRVGNTLRLVDLHSDVDLTFPADDNFSGKLWFDSRNMHEILG